MREWGSRWEKRVKQTGQRDDRGSVQVWQLAGDEELI